ncbi:MAG: hypothetical protein CMI00_00450 [Oceanospirillaceae bacterium]|nr:hypothetical protein [Oceanospirillaceae bacterium]|tara:strand:- start:28545 stop:31355 length:2811 start_codon:yes stop_codon:yes gene_type:complete
MRFFLSVLFGMLIHGVAAEPVAWDGPGSAGWETRSSEHFYIHFPAEGSYDALALRSLQIAEKAYQELVPFFGSAPVLKTHLVMSDDHDISNGWATFFPFPQIRLYLTPPYTLSGLQNYDDWLSLLIRHEYVHILHMELSGRIPDAGQSILGRFPFFFPHSLTSPMLIEGLAVYEETDYQKGTGRLASSWYQMQMREEVRSGEFDTLGEAAIASRDWPYGKYYLYGAFFTEYLIRTYGEDAFKRWLTYYSGEIIPWVLQDKVARQAFGKDFESLWADFRLAMEERFALSPGTDIRMDAAPESGLLPDQDGSVRLQVADANGRELVYIAANDEDRPVIRRCDAQWTCHDDRVPTLGNYSQLALSATGDAATVRQTLTAGGRITSDISVFTPQRRIRMTENMRVAQLAWVSGGQGLVFSAYREGRPSLYRLPARQEYTELWQGGYGDVVGRMAVSPDGRYLVAARKQQGQGWNLARFDLSTLEWTSLSSAEATETDPYFTPEGELLYVADYRGLYNIYRWTDAGPESLTDSASGAFAPAVLGDQLVYQEYTADGFAFRTADFMPLTEPMTVTPEIPAETVPLPEIAVSEPVAYEPWSTLRPYYWLPFVESGDNFSWIGVTTGGSDALQRHNYAVTVQYDLEDQLLAGNLMYIYQRWMLMADADYDKIQVVEGDEDYTHVRDDTLLLQRNYLFRAFEDSLGVHAGLVHQRTAITHLEDGLELIGANAYSRDSIGLAATLSLTGSLLQSPGPGYGSYTHLVYEDFDLLSTDASGSHLQAGWQYTFDLPGRNGLTLSLLGGAATDDAPGFRLGGLPPEEDYSLFGRDKLSLRGYPSAVQRGQYYERERLSLRSELASYQDNWDIWPVGADSLELGLYLERGRAWDDTGPGSENSALVGAAAELRLNLILAYRLRAPLVLGVASPLGNEEGENEVYGGLQFTF